MQNHTMLRHESHSLRKKCNYFGHVGSRSGYRRGPLFSAGDYWNVLPAPRLVLQRSSEDSRTCESRCYIKPSCPPASAWPCCRCAAQGLSQAAAPGLAFAHQRVYPAQESFHTRTLATSPGSLKSFPEALEKALTSLQ